MDNQLKINEAAGKKIAEARERKRWTQTEAADRLGSALNQGYSLRQYQKLEKGVFPKFKKEVILKLDEILGTKVYELIYEPASDDQPGRDDLGPNYRKQLWYGKIAHDDEKYVPLIPYSARAGYSKNYENIDYIADSFEMFPILPGVKSRSGRDWRYFEVKGDSMEPVLHDKNIVLCSLYDYEDWEDVDFEVYVTVYNNDIVIKRLAFDKGDLIFVSENEDEYPQKRVPLSKVKEIWKVRRVISGQLKPSKRFKITV